jgi:hypothetical protein
MTVGSCSQKTRLETAATPSEAKRSLAFPSGSRLPYPACHHHGLQGVRCEECRPGNDHACFTPVGGDWMTPEKRL